VDGWLIRLRRQQRSGGIVRRWSGSLTNSWGRCSRRKEDWYMCWAMCRRWDLYYDVIWSVYAGVLWYSLHLGKACWARLRANLYLRGFSTVRTFVCLYTPSVANEDSELTMCSCICVNYAQVSVAFSPIQLTICTTLNSAHSLHVYELYESALFSNCFLLQFSSFVLNATVHMP
jgi:hypothetical protein